MMEAYLAASGTMADRLMTALEAAQAAGGDWRGQEAGRVLVVRGRAERRCPGSDVVCDVRVDNHPEPVAELRRLVGRSQALRAAWSPDAGVRVPMRRRPPHGRRAWRRATPPSRRSWPPSGAATPSPLARCSTASSPSSRAISISPGACRASPTCSGSSRCCPGWRAGAARPVSRPGAGRAGSRGRRSPGPPVRPPPGWAPDAAQVEPGDRQPMASEPHHRPPGEELVERRLAVVDVTAGEAVLALELAGRQHRGFVTSSPMPGAYALELCHHPLADRLGGGAGRHPLRQHRPAGAPSPASARPRVGMVASSIGLLAQLAVLRGVERLLEVVDPRRDHDPARAARRRPSPR